MAAEGGIFGECVKGLVLRVVVVSRQEGLADQNHMRLLESHGSHARKERWEIK